MQPALDAFNSSMARVRALHGLHASLAAQVTPALDLSDILRSEIVLSVSAFDFYVHELTRLGMLECQSGIRPKTDAFNRFPVALGVAGSLGQMLDVEIRTRHGYMTFQQPDKVADAIRLFSGVELWNTVAAAMGTTPTALKASLSLIVDRRNKIAHEADLDPSYPGQRWPIDRAQVEYTIELLEKVATQIFAAAA